VTFALVLPALVSGPLPGADELVVALDDEAGLFTGAATGDPTGAPSWPAPGNTLKVALPRILLAAHSPTLPNCRGRTRKRHSASSTTMMPIAMTASCIRRRDRFMEEAQ
jgi:hypothetical protein